MNSDTPTPEAPKPSDGTLGREVHIFASERAEPPRTSNNQVVALLAAGCTVMGVVVGFSLGMVAGSRATHTGHCPAQAQAAPVLAASPATLAPDRANQPGFLGIQFVTYEGQRPTITSQPGAYITEVFDNTAADRLGLRVADVITAVDGKRIRSSNALVEAIWHHEIGDTVAITFYSGGEMDTKNVTLGAIPREHEPRFRRWKRARSRE